MSECVVYMKKQKLTESKSKDLIHGSSQDYFAPLRKELESYFTPEQIAETYRAYQLAEKAHHGQQRHSGEAYITHPVAVAEILADLRMDKESIIAALLHDVIEDTSVDKDTIIKEFNEDIANLVEGLTKLTQIKFESRAEQQAENFRKMFLAMVKDIRIILVKLADRLHNMRTLDVLSATKRRRIARETLEIYAPISNRLGMHNFHIELEELGFAALYPMRYRVFDVAVHRARGDHEEILTEVKQAIQDNLQAAALHHCTVWGREKHLYGIYKKMSKKRLSFSEIMDVFAFRIIVDRVDECYRALGVVHNIYKPVPERFKDYIAIPKVNGYQSLHTTLFGPYGIPIEIQIRTAEMDQMADSGIAAHWRYKHDSDHDANGAQKRAREWVRGLLEMQQSAASSLEFIENVKFDLFPDEVYIFTPKGNIFELPAGATPVDFAYAIHSDIGNSCVAVKIERRLAPLSTPLISGQTVEVITTPGARPNPAWLNFVVTGKARSNIRHYLKQQRHEESINLGRFLLNKALESLGIKIDDVSQDLLNGLLDDLEQKDLDDLLENIGLGNQIAVLVARRLAGLDAGQKQHETEADQEITQNTLPIKGSDGMVVSFATCCYPIPGDPVVGFLQKGQGLQVHVDQCSYVKNLLRKKADNIIPVRWEEQVDNYFQVALAIEVENHRGVLAAVTSAISNAEANIDDIQVDAQDGKYNTIQVLLSLHDRVHLARVMRSIRRVSPVERITRIRR